MTRRKIEDVKTRVDQIAYAQMLRRRWEEIPYDAPPSEILDFDKYPMPDPTRPWTHPEYADHVAREKKRRRRG